MSLDVSKEKGSKTTTIGDKQGHEQSSGAASSIASRDKQAQEEKSSGASSFSKTSPSSCEGIFAEVHPEVTKEILVLFRCLAEISDGSNYVMKFLGEVPHLYCRECNNNGVHYFGESDKGFLCDGCQNYLKSSAVKPLRHRLKNRADLFRRAVQIQYKSHLMKSDVEDSGRFFKTYPKSLSDGEKDFLRTEKSRLDFHHDLNFTLSPEELHPEGSEVDQVPEADYFLNNFIMLYK